MRAFWMRLALVLPIPLLVIGFNWVVDPVHLRNPDAYERAIAQLILDGRPVTNISNPNEAAFVTSYIEGLKRRKDVLVFGSSRSKLIRSDSFPGLSFFNNSISGGGLVDDLAIYELYAQKHLLPSHAVIELSPWLLGAGYASIWKTLNANQEQLERQILSPGQRHNNGHRVTTPFEEHWSEFLSPGYFQTSFYTWLRGWIDQKQHAASYFVWQPGTLPVGETLLADGSAIYPERVENPEEKERVTALAIQYAQAPAGIPNDIDPGCQKVFEAFLDTLAGDGVHAILYLPPYHPLAYAGMVNSAHNRIIVREQEYFQDLARRKGLPLIGSYNPAELSLDESEFLDGSHPNEFAVRQLFASRDLGVKTADPAPSADEIKVVGVENPNGLEVVNHKAFFWIGDGDTCVNVRSSRAGVAVLRFHALPGPSLQTTARRALLLRTSNGFSRVIVLPGETDTQTAFPVAQGPNEIRLTPLDKPAVAVQANGDRRPLLVGASDVTAELLPPQTSPPPVGELPFTFVSGWHQVEHSGPDWLCWTDGHGLISIAASNATSAVLFGQVLAAQRPDSVDVLLNGNRVATLSVEWSNWVFRAFPPIELSLRAGSNAVEFVGHQAPVRLPHDDRLLAVAVKDLGIVIMGN